MRPLGTREVRACADGASGCECLLSMASRRGAVPTSAHDSITTQSQQSAGARAMAAFVNERQLRAGIQLLDLCEHVAAGQTRGEWSEIQVCACVRETRQSSEDNDTAQCSLSRLAQLSTSSLLSWALGNEESCSPLSEQVARATMCSRRETRQCGWSRHTRACTRVDERLGSARTRHAPRAAPAREVQPRRQMLEERRHAQQQPSRPSRQRLGLRRLQLPRRRGLRRRACRRAYGVLGRAGGVAASHSCVCEIDDFAMF